MNYSCGGQPAGRYLPIPQDCSLSREYLPTRKSKPKPKVLHPEA